MCILPSSIRLTKYVTFGSKKPQKQDGDGRVTLRLQNVYKLQDDLGELNSPTPNISTLDTSNTFWALYVIFISTLFFV